MCQPSVSLLLGGFRTCPPGFLALVYLKHDQPAGPACKVVSQVGVAVLAQTRGQSWGLGGTEREQSLLPLSSSSAFKYGLDTGYSQTSK